MIIHDHRRLQLLTTIFPDDPHACSSSFSHHHHQGYKDELAKAKAERNNGGSNEENNSYHPPPPPPTPSSSSSFSPLCLIPTEEESTHLNTIISLLNKRLSTNTPLTKPDLDSFYKATHAVMGPERNNVLPDTEGLVRSSSRISSVSKDSTYYVEGMEDMTPQEYRVALMKKGAEAIKERVMGGGVHGNEAAWSYMDGLTQSKQKKRQDKQQQEE